MAINNKFSLIVAAAAMLVMCVGFSAAVLVRSTPSDSERVHDFVISSNVDSPTASWTAYGRQWVVHLELSGVMQDNTDYYHGTLEGDASAVVSFSLLPGVDLSGMIITGTDTWWIRAVPLPENDHSTKPEDLGIFMVREHESASASSSAQMPALGEPLVAEPSSSSSDESNTNARRTATMTTYKAAIFYDQNWATASNNPWSSQANTMSILNDVNAVYKAAGLNQFTFVYQKQISNSYTDLTDILNYFSDTASSTLSAFSDKSFTNYAWLIGTNVGGLAYVGTTCSGSASAQNRKTAVMGLANFSRLWTVKTIAHELGHNRGATHQFTDMCSGSMTTGCQCSEMSYCFPSATNNPTGAVNYFSSFTVTEMQAAGCY